MRNGKHSKNVSCSKKTFNNKRLANRLDHGCSRLMHACQQGDNSVAIKALHSKPEQIRIRDSHNRNALHYCAAHSVTHPNNLVAAASIAIAAPDLLESADEDGFTPLHLAIIQGNLEMVNLLLANKANVNAVDKEGHSVTHWATVCGEVEALRAILAAGANIAIPDINGGTPLHYAAQMCGATYDCKLSKSNSIKLALSILETLLAHPQCKVDVQDKEGRQPLLWAASSGSAKAIIALIKAGARVESADKDGLTALHCAASRGHTECIDTLISLCGAPTDLIDCNGCTALHYAVTLGHADATSRLLDLEADPNRQDRKGRTPAHCGCAKGQFETVKLLNEHQANLWLRNAKGDLPMHEAAVSGRRELVEWLLEQRPKQINVTSNDGRSMLHIAAQHNYTDLCKVLLDYGAEVNAVYRNSKGVVITPLDCALQKGHRATAKFLQSHGGLPSAKLRLSNQRSNPFDEIAMIDMVRPLKYVDKEEDLNNTKKYIVCVNRSDSDADDVIYRYCKYHKYADKCYKTVAYRKYHDLKSLRRRTNSCSEPEKCKNGEIYRSKSNIEIRRGKRDERYLSSSDCDDEDSCENCCYHKHTKHHILRKKPVLYKSMKNRHYRYDHGKSITNQNTILNNGLNGAIKDLTKTKTDEDNDDDVKNSREENEGEVPRDSANENLESKTSNTDKPLEDKLEYDSKEAEATQVVQKDMTASMGEIFDDNKITTEEGITENKNGDANEVEAIEEKLNDIKINETNVIGEKSDDLTINEVDASETETSAITTEPTAIVDIIHEGKEPIEPEEPKEDVDDQLLKETPSDEETFKANEDLQMTESVSDILKQKDEKNEEMEKNYLEEKFIDNNVAADELQDPQQLSMSSPLNIHPLEKDKTSLKDEVSNTDINKNTNGIVSDVDELDTQRERISDAEPLTSDDFNLDLSTLRSKSEKVKQEDRKSSFQLLSSESEDVEHIEEQPERKSSFQIIKSDDDSMDDFDQDNSNLLDHKDSAVFQVLSPTESADIQASPYKGFKDSTGTKPTTGIEMRSKSKAFKNLNNISPSSRAETTPYSNHLKAVPKIYKRDQYLTGYSVKDHDSGFEPSPRCLYTKILAPRGSYTTPHVLRRPLYTTLDRRSCTHKKSRKSDEMRFCDITAVTKSIQRNIRRYYMERKIFQHLLELKSLQIRSNKLNEAVLVKRAVDDYHKSCTALGGEIGARLRRYKFGEYSFKNFELFLYETLKSLQKPGTYNFKNIGEVYEEAERRLSPDYHCYEKALQCTTKTHRCLHATHAYTGIPCAAYIPMMNHHTMPKFGFGPYKRTGMGNIYLPKILSTGRHCSGKIALELTHGKRKQLISLPSEGLDSNKKYYVTFEVKNSPTNDGGMYTSPSSDGKIHSAP